jgi:hypothetical protein
MGQKEKKGAARGGEIKRKKEGTLTRESRQQQPPKNCQRDNTTHHRDAVRCVFIFFLKKKTHFSLSTFSSSTLFWGAADFVRPSPWRRCCHCFVLFSPFYLISSEDLCDDKSRSLKKIRRNEGAHYTRPFTHLRKLKKKKLSVS